MTPGEVRHFLSLGAATNFLMLEGFYSIGPTMFMRSDNLYASVHPIPGVSFVMVAIAPMQ